MYVLYMWESFETKKKKGKQKGSMYLNSGKGIA